MSTPGWDITLPHGLAAESAMYLLLSLSLDSFFELKRDSRVCETSNYAKDEVDGN